MKKSVITFTILFIITAAVTILFAIWSRDRGSWEALRMVSAIPPYVALGIAGLIAGIVFLTKKDYSITTGGLLILGIVYVTYFPALWITQKVQDIIFFKQNLEEEMMRNDFNFREYKEFEHSFELLLKEPVIISDIESDRILVQQIGNFDQGVAIFRVTNAEQIGLLINPNSFKGQLVKLSLEIPKNSELGFPISFPESKEGASLIARNAEESWKASCLKHNLPKISMECWYSFGSMDLFSVGGDIPVSLK